MLEDAEFRAYVVVQLGSSWGVRVSRIASHRIASRFCQAHLVSAPRRSAFVLEPRGTPTRRRVFSARITNFELYGMVRHGHDHPMRRFQHWLDAIADSRKSGTTFGMWLGTAILVLVVLVLASSVVPINGWFQLRFWPALLAFIPSFVLGVVTGWFDQRGRVSLRMYGILFLVGSFLLQFFFGALIALSHPPGSLALASLLVLTLAFHGYLGRASSRFPYMLVASTLALTAALLVNSNKQTLTTFAFVAPTGLLVSMLTGTAGLQEHADRRRLEKLRQAVYYRMLNERTEETERVSGKLIDLLSNHHDAGNILSTVFLNAQLLGEQIAGATEAAIPMADIDRGVTRLLDHLSRLKALIHRGHAVAEGMVEVHDAPVLDVVQEVVADCCSLYPTANIRVGCCATDVLQVRVHEGALGLRRITENLLHNACEGNGETWAQQVRVDIEVEENTVLLRCVDDGPGFSSAQLSLPLEPFKTTKKEGHGLGLYNVRYLVQASGGTITRSNGSEGGAVVSIRLARSQVATCDERSYAELVV